MTAMTYDEIERAYPDEWVLIAEPDEADGGIVVAHSADRDELNRRALDVELRSAAIYFVPGPRDRSRDLAFLL